MRKKFWRVALFALLGMGLCVATWTTLDWAYGSTKWWWEGSIAWGAAALLLVAFGALGMLED